MDHVAFATTDADALHSYFVAHHYGDIDAVKSGSDGSKWFFTRDPEGNRVEFFQPAAHQFHASENLVSPRIIHVGFLVKDRAVEDHFYRDLLGFRPYWYGAMHPGKLDWVAQQVPDGPDWLEYMMTGPGSDSGPADKVDARQLGVMNHFSLGVPNMEKAVTALYVARHHPLQSAARRSNYGQGRQVAGEPLRSRRDARGADGVPAGDEAVLLRLHRGEPGGLSI